MPRGHKDWNEFVAKRLDVITAPGENRPFLNPDWIGRYASP